MRCIHRGCRRQHSVYFSTAVINFDNSGRLKKESLEGERCESVSTYVPVQFKNLACKGKKCHFLLSLLKFTSSALEQGTPPPAAAAWPPDNPRCVTASTRSTAVLRKDIKSLKNAFPSAGWMKGEQKHEEWSVFQLDDVVAMLWICISGFHLQRTRGVFLHASVLLFCPSFPSAAENCLILYIF